MRKPDFLIIGVQKGATTWLHQMLRQHPGIFLPEAKDGGFFCWQGNDNAAALSRYCENFRAACADQLIGESTAAYFWTRTGSAYDNKPAGYHRDIAGHVRHALGGDTRLLLTLRHPVKRAISAFLHYQAMGELSQDCRLSDVLDFGGIVDIGFYAQHLRSWLQHFSTEQLCVLIKETDVAQQPEQGLARVLAHLGLASDWQPEAIQQAVFTGRTRQWLRDGVWVERDGQPQQLASAADIHELRTLYRDDIAELEEMLKRPLGELWQ
jgi:hypothetical protein